MRLQTFVFFKWLLTYRICSEREALSQVGRHFDPRSNRFSRRNLLCLTPKVKGPRGLWPVHTTLPRFSNTVDDRVKFWHGAYLRHLTVEHASAGKECEQEFTALLWERRVLCPMTVRCADHCRDEFGNVARAVPAPTLPELARAICCQALWYRVTGRRPRRANRALTEPKFVETKTIFKPLCPNDASPFAGSVLPMG